MIAVAELKKNNSEVDEFSLETTCASLQFIDESLQHGVARLAAVCRAIDGRRLTFSRPSVDLSKSPTD